MSGLGTLALVLVSAWMGVLSVVTALLVRQVALLTHRVDPDYALDGLAVGRRMPRSIAELLPGGSGSVLVLGVGCTPCRELVHDLQGFSIEQAVVAVIEGDEALAATLAETLPTGFQVMTGEKASRAYSDLELQTTPFLITVERREIVHKIVPRGSQHFLSLLEPLDTKRSQPRVLNLEVTNVG